MVFKPENCYRNTIGKYVIIEFQECSCLTHSCVINCNLKLYDKVFTIFSNQRLFLNLQYWSGTFAPQVETKFLLNLQDALSHLD